MLTLLDALSLAGDRAKQNDDAGGAHGALAWVIDGATDLHDAPFATAATDAAWLAQELNADLAARAIGLEASETALRAALREASEAAAETFAALTEGEDVPLWARPIASALLIAETADGLTGVDLGDCRLFALDAAGQVHALGGPDDAVDAEAASAAKARDQQGGRPDQDLYRTGDVIAHLRAQRAAQNADPRHAVFSLDPGCADRARAWTLPLARPAHVLLASDGFAALADRYGAYDPESLMRAALSKGVHALASELRAIESDDAGGARHPRFKRSDDATALLLRLV